MKSVELLLIQPWSVNCVRLLKRQSLTWPCLTPPSACHAKCAPDISFCCVWKNRSCYWSNCRLLENSNQLSSWSDVYLVYQWTLFSGARSVFLREARSETPSLSQEHLQGTGDRYGGIQGLCWRKSGNGVAAIRYCTDADVPGNTMIILLLLNGNYSVVKRKL